MTETSSPTIYAAWQAPDEVRMPLLAARQALAEAEEACDAGLRVAGPAFAAILGNVPTPETRERAVRVYGRTRNVFRGMSLWQPVLDAHVRLLAAEAAYQDAIPAGILVSPVP